MFGLFTETSVSRRTAIQNENNVMTKKPTLSTRKPLADCKLNVNQEFASSAKPEVSPRSAFKENQVHNDIFDFCSYKEIKDNYEDLQTPDLVLGEVANNIISIFSDRNLREPDPVQFVFERPKLVDVSYKLFDPDIMGADDVMTLLSNEFECSIDPELPFDDFL